MWTETLTDTADPSTMAKAREDLSQINMKLLRAALDGGLGRDYEYQDYVRWVGETEKTFFGVIVEAGIWKRASSGAPEDKNLEKKMAAPSRRRRPSCSSTPSARPLARTGSPRAPRRSGTSLSSTATTKCSGS